MSVGKKEEELLSTNSNICFLSHAHLPHFFSQADESNIQKLKFKKRSSSRSRRSYKKYWELHRLRCKESELLKSAKKRHVQQEVSA